MRKWKRQIVAALVGLYPARWRREYGEEFRDVLTRRPLDAATVVDAIWSALGQQLRSGEPWIIVGVPWLALNLATILWNILYSGPYQFDSLGGNRPNLIPLLGLLLPVTIGYWTVLRDPINGRGGRADRKTWRPVRTTVGFGPGRASIIGRVAIDPVDSDGAVATDAGAAQGVNPGAHRR